MIIFNFLRVCSVHAKMLYIRYFMWYINYLHLISSRRNPEKPLLCLCCDQGRVVAVVSVTRRVLAQQWCLDAGWPPPSPSPAFADHAPTLASCSFYGRPHCPSTANCQHAASKLGRSTSSQWPLLFIPCVLPCRKILTFLVPSVLRAPKGSEFALNLPAEWKLH